MSLETTSGTISTQPLLRHAEGRSELRTIYTTDQERLKQIIVDVYTNRIIEFIKIAHNPEGRTYDFTTHNWRAITDEDGDAKTDVRKASRDFLVQRVEQLAKSFVEETGRSEELVKDFLLYKLGVGQFKSTEEFIENGQTTIGMDHRKLSTLLTKIHEGTFKEKAPKLSESDTVSSKEATTPLNSPSLPNPTTPLSLSPESSEQLLAGLSSLPPPDVDHQDTPSASDEDSTDDGYDSRQSSDEDSIDDGYGSPVSEGYHSASSSYAKLSDKTSKSAPASLIMQEPVPNTEASTSVPIASSPEPELLMAASSSNAPDEPAIAYLESTDSDSQVDEADQTNLAEEVDSVDEQPKTEESEQPKKSRSAIARFFARIGNGIEKFFMSIFNFFKNLFSKK